MSPKCLEVPENAAIVFFMPNTHEYFLQTRKFVRPKLTKRQSNTAKLKEASEPGPQHHEVAANKGTWKTVQLLGSELDTLLTAPLGSFSVHARPSQPLAPSLYTVPKPRCLRSQVLPPPVPGAPLPNTEDSGTTPGGAAARHKPSFLVRPRDSGSSPDPAIFTEGSHQGLGETCVSGPVECCPQEDTRKTGAAVSLPRRSHPQPGDRWPLGGPAP